MAHTANEFRRLAEKTDGLRGVTLAIIEEKGVLEAIPESDPKVGDGAIRVRTEDSGASMPRGPQGMPHPTKIELSFNGNAVDVPDDVDALFISQSAVEKFVLPYYARFSTPQELEQRRSELFDDGAVIAVVHLPTSQMGTLKPEGAIKRLVADGIKVRLI
jgi:hypothetical protein